MSSATGVRVVGDYHIAGEQILVARDRFLYGVAERAEKARDAVALGDELPIHIGDADAEVEHLVNDRALRGALQRDEHLVADRREALAQYVHGEPVRSHWRASGTTLTWRAPDSSRMRLPTSSWRAVWSGRTNVVAA